MRVDVFPKRYFWVSDFIIFGLVSSALYGIVLFGTQSQQPFHASATIDLSLTSLPKYAVFSICRGLVAYTFSLFFSLIVGYWAAKSRTAEKFIIPILDIGQSIPALGFVPGFVIALTALFPNTTIGLEITAILAIFVSQVWNMAFSFYNSIKSIPSDYKEVAEIAGLSWSKRFWKLELPFGAVDLAWNSVMSMAGGWFFLTVCEAYTLEKQEYLLPGIGAYMAVAIKKGNTSAMISGLLTMLAIILLLDFFLWRPVLSWVRRFRLEEIPGQKPTEPLMILVLRDSRMLRWMRTKFQKRFLRGKKGRPKKNLLSQSLAGLTQRRQTFERNYQIWQRLGFVFGFFGLVIIFMASLRLVQMLASLPVDTWVLLLESTFFSFLRVIGALILSSIWTVPVGIWIALSPRRTHIAQPIIQIAAAFPAPMLFPFILAICTGFGMPFGLTSMILMFFGVQWYLLFNVLAGAMKISPELRDSLDLAKTAGWVRWKHLYFPTVFPSLVTGWVLAAGGAWNATIVAEYMTWKGTTFSTKGLGSVISVAADNGQFRVLAAGITLMVIVVVGLDRLLWARVYKIAHTRFKLD